MGRGEFTTTMGESFLLNLGSLKWRRDIKKEILSFPRASRRIGSRDAMYFFLATLAACVN